MYSRLSPTQGRLQLARNAAPTEPAADIARQEACATTRVERCAEERGARGLRHVSSRAEAGHGREEHAGVLLWDMVKFYESLNHERIWQQAKMCGLPLQLVRLALNAYRWTRWICMGPRVYEGIDPLRAVVAGCSLVTVLIKVYVIRDLDRFVERWHSLRELLNPT